MKYTTEDVALRVLESLMVGGMSKALLREHDADKLVRRAYVFADKFIAERDQRRAEVAEPAEEMRELIDYGFRDDEIADLSARINRVSRRSLDGSVVMSSKEWNGIVELVEKLLTAAPQADEVIDAAMAGGSQ